MADGGALVLPGVAGKSTAQLLDLSYGSLVPGAEALHCERKEHDPLLVTGLPRFVHLTLVSDGEGMARSFSSPSHRGSLEGIDHRYIQGCILAACVSGDEDVSGLACFPRQQVLTFLCGSKRSLDSSAVESIPEAVMPCNTFALPGTVEGVVSLFVTRLAASRARPISPKNSVAKAVTEGGNKLGGVKEQAESRRGNNREPVASMCIFEAD